MRHGLGFHNRRSPGVAIFSPASLFAGGVQGAWYDPSDFGPSGTLFQDSAGTTPVTAVEQPVGLMLDKSKNGVGTNGAYRYNLLTYTEQFDNAAWVKDGSTAANTTATTDPLGGNTADVLTATAAIYAYTYQLTPVSTITATFSCYVKAATASVFWLYYENGVQNGIAYFGTDLTTQVVAGSSQTPSNLTITSVGNGWFRISAQWSTVAGSRNFGVGISDAKGSQAITIGRAGYIWGAQAASAAAPTAYQRITDTWYNTLPGNHAYQTTSASRPTLRARYNLLTYSEQFDNAVWTKNNSTAANTTATTDPLGGTTADVYTNTGSSDWLNTASAITIVAGLNYTYSIYAKRGTQDWLRLSGWNEVSGAAQAFNAWFNLATGVKGTLSSGADGTAVSHDMVSVGNGWYRCTVVGRSTALTTLFPELNMTTADAVTTRPATGNEVYIWGAQLVPTAVFPSNTYQRIGAATDYATGAAFPPYLFFDGTDDSMLTNSVDFTGTDKMLVVAGVTKQAQAINQRIVEFSADTSTNPGTFQMWPGDWATGTGSRYSFSSRGTAAIAQAQAAESPANYAAPISNVLTATGDINGDSSILRINGAQVATGTGDQGTGNYGNYPLYIGRRNNATLPFNGSLFSLIIAGQSYTAGQISSTESWVAAKTPLGTI